MLRNGFLTVSAHPLKNPVHFFSFLTRQNFCFICFFSDRRNLGFSRNFCRNFAEIGIKAQTGKVLALPEMMSISLYSQYHRNSHYYTGLYRGVPRGFGVGGWSEQKFQLPGGKFQLIIFSVLWRKIKNLLHKRFRDPYSGGAKLTFPSRFLKKSANGEFFFYKNCISIEGMWSKKCLDIIFQMRSLNFSHIMLLSYSKPVPSIPNLFLLGGAVAPPDP